MLSSTLSRRLKRRGNVVPRLWRANPPETNLEVVLFAPSDAASLPPHALPWSGIDGVSQPRAGFLPEVPVAQKHCSKPRFTPNSQCLIEIASPQNKSTTPSISLRYELKKKDPAM